MEGEKEEKREIWGEMAMGVETPNFKSSSGHLRLSSKLPEILKFYSAAGARAATSWCLSTQLLETYFLSA